MTIGSRLAALQWPSCVLGHESSHRASRVNFTQQGVHQALTCSCWQCL
jgi:hypothetical protein